MKIFSFGLAFLSLVILSLGLFAQPNGTLYVQQPAALEFIDYPSGQTGLIDSVASSDLAIYDNLLFAAGGGRYANGEDVYVYNLDSRQQETVIPGTEALWLDIWENKLVVASSTAPFLRVYDITDNYNLLFTVLDSATLGGAASDMLVSEDRAYVLTGTGLAVVDLDLEDTLTVIESLYDPNISPGFRYNGYISELGENLYVETSYATGAYRSDYFRVNKQSLQVDSIFHAEFYLSELHPVEAGDRLYIYWFDSYYDAVSDSFSLVQVTTSNPKALAYDDASETLFVYDPLQGGVFTHHNGTSAPPVSITTQPVTAIFYDDSQTSIEDELELEYGLRLFPNPASEQLTINLNTPQTVESIRVFNSKGQLVIEKRISSFADRLDLSVSSLSRGGYFLEVAYQDKRVRSQFVKW